MATVPRLSNNIREQYSEEHYKNVHQDKPTIVTTPYKVVYQKDNRFFALALTTGASLPVRITSILPIFSAHILFSIHLMYNCCILFLVTSIGCFLE